MSSNLKVPPGFDDAPKEQRIAFVQSSGIALRKILHRFQFQSSTSASLRSASQSTGRTQELVGLGARCVINC